MCFEPYVSTVLDCHRELNALCETVSSRAAHSDGDDDLTFSVSLSDVGDRLTDLAERVRPANDRRELPGLQ